MHRLRRFVLDGVLYHNSDLVEHYTDPTANRVTEARSPTSPWRGGPSCLDSFSP